MIGNDIVDLSISHVGESPRRERYLKKIFTDEEISIIESLGNEDHWIWLLWSIKESVYKIISRKEKRIRYAPKTIQCRGVNIAVKNSYESIIEYEGIQFSAFSEVKPEYIHSIAVESGFERYPLESEIFDIPKDVNEKDFVNNEILSALEKKLEITTNLSIQRDVDRVPHLYNENQEIGYLSISHHGGYGAFVLTSELFGIIKI